MPHYLHMIFFFSERIRTSWDPVKLRQRDLGISLLKGIHQLHSNLMSRQKQVISQLLPLPQLSSGEGKLGSLSWEELGCAHFLILDLETWSTPVLQLRYSLSSDTAPSFQLPVTVNPAKKTALERNLWGHQLCYPPQLPHKNQLQECGPYIWLSCTVYFYSSSLS